MNLLLNLKNHSLVKERPPPDSVGSSPPGRSTGFSRRTRVSRPLVYPADAFRRQPSRMAADSFEFGKMSVGNSDSFQASCPYFVSVTGSASDPFLAGGTKRGGVMRKGCNSGSSLSFLCCVFLSVTTSRRARRQ